MNTLAESFRYNRWADARVFKVCERADAGLLIVDAGGTNGTVLSTLAHMCGTAEGFAALVSAGAGGRAAVGEAPEFLVTPAGLADGYSDHDLAWYGDRVAYLDSFFFDFVGGLDETSLGLSVEIPWFGFAISAQQILMQVLVHCAHHRSQVFSALGAQGVKVPDLDYIIMLAKERAPS
ncbi:MAG: DinB family protein [Candidatus Dormibacteria bacterium]